MKPPNVCKKARHQEQALFLSGKKRACGIGRTLSISSRVSQWNWVAVPVV